MDSDKVCVDRDALVLLLDEAYSMAEAIEFERGGCLSRAKLCAKGDEQLTIIDAVARTVPGYVVPS